jgi:hypothetical protein
MPVRGRLHHLIFLLDGTGALLSAGLLLMLYTLEVGLPDRVMVFLAGVALVFALYAFGCHFLRPVRWPSFLRLVAVANLLYAISTVGFVLLFYEQTPIPGRIFFFAEAGVLLALASFELRIASNPEK